MKRFWMITLVLGLLAGFGLATAFSAVYAQTDTPQTPQTPWQGMMGGGMMRGGRGGMMGGMMGGYARQDGEQGPMHEYMEAELAAKLGLTVEEYEKLWNEGQTFWQIAEAQGVSTEDAQQMMLDAHNAALDKMVADGVITSEQAEFMNNHMNGAGGCQGGGMMGGRGGLRGNW